MSILKTQPSKAGERTQTHILPLPECCPISHNPRSGSTIAITYTTHGDPLEIGSLFAEIHKYKGGYHEDGVVVVRDMETMITHLAQQCANVARVPVSVVAELELLPRQHMRIETERYPESEQSA